MAIQYLERDEHMQISILITLIACYLVVCRQNYLNLAKGSAHCRQHPVAGLAVVGALLTLGLTGYAHYLMKPVDIRTFMLTYVTICTPFYGALLIGLLGKKRQLIDANEAHQVSS